MSKNRCPNCIAPKGKDCPMWIGPEHGVLEQSDTTGGQRLVTGCFPTVFIRLMEFVVRSNNSAAASIQSHRNVIADGLDGIARVIDGASRPVRGNGPLLTYDDEWSDAR